MAGNIGEANVEIHANTDKVRNEVRDGLNKGMDGVGSDAGKKFSDDFDKESSKGLSGVASRLSAKLSDAFSKSGDDAGSNFASRIKAKLDGIGKEKIKAPDMDVALLEAKIAKLKAKIEELGKMKSSAKVEADTTIATIQLDKLKLKLDALAANERHIKLDIDQKGLTQSLVGVAALARALNTLFLPAAIIGATPAIASLGAAAVQLSGLLYTLPAAFGAAALGVGTLVVGLHGLGAALGPTGTPAQIKKVNEAMATLAPNAKSTVVAIRGLSDEWKALRSNIQDRLFAGISDDIKPLAGIYLPMLQGAMGATADSFNLATQRLLGFMRSKEGISAMGAGFFNLKQATADFAAIIYPLGKVFIQLFDVGSSYVATFAGHVKDLAFAFAAFIDNAYKTGQINKWIDQAVVVFNQLFAVVKNVGSILYTLFQAGQEGAGSFLQVLAMVTGEVDKFLKSPEGHDALVALFKTIHDTASALIPGLLALGSALAQSIIALGPVLPNLATAFSNLVIAAAPFVVQLAQLLSFILPPLIGLLNLLSPILGPLVVAFGAMYGAMSLIGGTISMFKDLAKTMKLAQIAQEAWTAAQWLFNAAVNANALSIIVIAIGALVLALIYAYNHSEAFRKMWDEAFAAVKGAIIGVIDWFKKLPDEIGAAISAAGAWFGGLYDSAAAVGTRVIDWVSNLPTQIGSALSSLGTTISTASSNAWDSLVTSATNAGTAVLQWLADLPGNIAYGLGYIAGAVARGSVTAFWGIVDGAIAAWDATWAFFVALPGRLGAFFTALGSAIWNGAVNAFNNLTEAVGHAVVATYEFFVSLPDRIASALTSLGNALYDAGVAALNGLYNGAVSGFNIVNNWLTGLRDRFWAAVDSAGDWLVQTGVEILTGMLNGIVRGYAATAAWFVGLPAAIANFFAAAGTWLYNVGADILNGLVNGLEAGWNAVWSWVTGMVDRFIQGFKDGFQISSPSALFAQFGSWVLEGFLNGLNTVVQAILAFVSTFVNNFISGFNNLLTMFIGIWDSINSSVQTIVGAIIAFIDSQMQNILGFVTNVMNAVLSFWTSIWGAIQTYAQNVLGAIYTFISQQIQNIYNFIQTTLNAVLAFWQSIWNAIKAFGESLWNALVSFYQSGFTNWRGLFEAFGSAIRAFWESIWNAIKAFGEQIWNAIVAFFRAGFTNLQNLVTQVMNAVRTFWESVWNAISAFAQSVWNSFSSFINGALNAFRALIETVMNAVKATWSTIWTAIEQFGRTTWNNFNSFITGAINGFSTFWSGAWTKIKDGFNSAFGGIVAIATSIWTNVKNVFRDGVNAIINGVNWPINKINGLFSISIATIPQFAGFATGGDLAGRVKGIGGRRADRVPAMLSPEEHVWSDKEVRGAGGHSGVRKIRALARQGLLDGLADGGPVTQRTAPDLTPGAFVVNPIAAEVAGRFLEALNNRQPEATQATGGRYARGPRTFSQGGNIERFQAGGAIANALAVGRGMQGTPYVWGGASRSGADCSGFQSIITNALNMKPNPYSRIGSTANFPWRGFQNGYGTYTIGSTPNAGNGIGHMAGTLAGTNVESGSGHGAMVGGRALGATNGLFRVRAFLPQVGGTFIDGGGGGVFDPGAWFDALASGLKSLAESTIRGLVPDDPAMFEPMAVGMFDKSWEGMRNTAIKFISGIATGLAAGGTVAPASGPVNEQVRAVASQFGWGEGTQWRSLGRLISRESGWNPDAANPNSSARGLFGKTTSLYGPAESTAGQQAYWGLNYIASNYNNPASALARITRVGAYDTGGWLPPGVTTAINGTGKPEAIIADPMTTFERSFQKVFKWFAPQMQSAMASGNGAAFDSIVKALGGQKELGKEIGRAFDKLPRALQDAIRTQFPTIADALDSPQVDLVQSIRDIVVTKAPPVVAVPKPEIPPVIVPQVPTGPIGASFQDALRQFAPELSLALKAGAVDQTRALATDILANNERLAAISQAMGADVKPVLQSLLNSIRVPVPPVVTIPPITVPTPTWLQQEVERLRQYALANLTKGSDAGDRLEKVGDDFSWRLVRAFEAAFPDIENAIDSSKVDVNKTLAAQASDLLAWLQTRSAADQVHILEALDGQDRSLADALKSAQATVTVTPTSTSPALNIGDGAFQVTINGNADSVTVDQLRATLVAWSDDILHQYEGRT